jgi:hypothetical protein
VIYHRVDHDRVYRLSVALLDRDDPTRVRNWPKEPVLVPEEPWERAGEVPNVVFTCRTAELGDDYLIYYGGTDRVIGLATANKRELLDFAVNGGEGCQDCEGRTCPPPGHRYSGLASAAIGLCRGRHRVQGWSDLGHHTYRTERRTA